MKSLIYVFCLLAYSQVAYPQLYGHQNYPQLGLAFDIPEGWVGQEGDGMILLGSNTIPGFVMIATHQYNKQQLTDEARNGIMEEGGTSLKLVGELKNYAQNAIGGNFTGTLEGQPAKAYVIGVANPQAYGVTIMAATLKNSFTDEHQRACQEIYRSLKFSDVNLKKGLIEWKEWLSDSRLTYMNSYSSNSYVSGGLSAGSSTKKTIDLCKKGYFKFNGSSSATISGSNATMLNHGSDQGQGDWDLVLGEAGGYVLVLAYNDGTKVEYNLTYEDDKLYLNGTRYFVTSEGEYAPNCN